MPDTDVVSLLKEWGSQGLLDMPVVMMSGHATVDTAVEATRIGAVDFLEKPITMQKLLKTIAAGLARPVVPPGLMASARLPGGVRAAEQKQPLPTGHVAEMAVAEVPEAEHYMLCGIALDQPSPDARREFKSIYFESPP